MNQLRELWANHLVAGGFSAAPEANISTSLGIIVPFLCLTDTKWKISKPASHCRAQKLQPKIQLTPTLSYTRQSPNFWTPDLTMRHPPKAPNPGSRRRSRCEQALVVGSSAHQPLVQWLVDVGGLVSPVFFSTWMAWENAGTLREFPVTRHLTCQALHMPLGWRRSLRGRWRMNT